MLDVLRSLPREPSFDCVIADPPYNHGIWMRKPVDEYAAWCEEWLRECMARLRSGGLLYCYGWPEYLAHVAVRFRPDRQRWLIWHKSPCFTSFNSKFFQRTCEAILMLWHSNTLPKLYVDQIRVPHVARIERNGTERNRTVRASGKSTRALFIHHTLMGRLPKDIISFSPRNNDAHPSTKPLKLTKYLLRAVLRDDEPGDVLIPFAGSGSECRVAQSMGHNYLGIELDEKWVRLARETLAATVPML